MGSALSRSSDSKEERDGHPTCPLTFPKTRIKLDNSDTYQECRSLLLNIKGHPTHKAQLIALEGEDAQNVVDFLSIVAHEQDILDHEEGRFALSRLHELVGKTGVFPRFYELRGVEFHDTIEYGGAYSDFSTGEYRSQRLGIKMIRLFREDRKDMLKMYVKELVLWAHLSHINILPFYGVYLHHMTKRICLVSPFMNNGNLSDYLSSRPETPRLPLISDITNGLLYLHQRKIVHGDLKATNILISDDGRALIGDFGLSYIAVASGLMTSSQVNTGPPRWSAPELLRPDDETTQQTLESDIWSFSCLCYEVFTRKTPFYKLSDKRVFALLVTRYEIPSLPEVAELGDPTYDNVDPRMWVIMKRCWSENPAERPTCESIHRDIATLNIQDDRPEVLEHPQNGLFFWQEMRANSEGGVNYGRVRNILLKIQPPASQEVALQEIAPLYFTSANVRCESPVGWQLVP